MHFSKKNLYIVASVLMLCMLGVVVYFSFFSKKAEEAESLSSAQGGINAGKEKGLFQSGLDAASGSAATGDQSRASDMVSKVFYWQYGGKIFMVNHSFSVRGYEAFRALSKPYFYFTEIPKGTENDYFAEFVVDRQNLKINEILSSIIAKGTENHYSEDQNAEMIISFVQSISLDEAKAARAKAKTGGVSMNFPYETLFEGKGISIDKSFLLYSLLKKYGYGVALFSYDNANHMAVGIKCELAYSNYQSGYCYVETTNGVVPMGEVPVLNTQTGRAIPSSSSKYSDAGVVSLAAVEIYQKVDGKTYGKKPEYMNSYGYVSPEKGELQAKMEKKQKKLEDIKDELEELKEELNDEINNMDEQITEECQDKLDELQNSDTEDEDTVNDLIDEIRTGDDCSDFFADGSSAYADKWEEYLDKRAEYEEEVKKYFDQIVKNLETD